MDNEPGKNKNQSFAQQNKNSLIVVGIVIVLLVIYFSTKGPTEQGMDEQGNTQTTEQTTNDNAGENSSEKKSDSSEQPGQKPQDTPGDTKKDAPKTTGSQDQNGNLSFSGTLAKSDNETKGNLMVTTNRGTVYIRTSRDFSSLVGKSVTATADGTITAFTLKDIKAQDGSADQSSMTPTDTTAKGGQNETPPAGMVKEPDTTATFTFSGVLAKSDNPKGNYTISSGKTIIYLQTSKDYSMWAGNEVNLTATGNLQSFSNAKLEKK